MRDQAEAARAFSLLTAGKRPIWFTVLACLALVVATATGQAQVDGTRAPANATAPIQSAPSTGIQKGWNEIGVWGGISFDAPTLIGKTPSARFGNLGFRVGRVLAASKDVAFEWTFDAVPVAVLSVERFTVVPSGSGLFVVQKRRENVIGAGASPIGLKFNFRRQHRVQPFASTTGGFLYFGQDVPVPGATKFNFTYDFSGGVQVVNSSQRAFIVGYKYQHISNGGRSAINPGVDVQMIYAGFSVFH
jgi:hypothetical protein